MSKQVMGPFKTLAVMLVCATAVAQNAPHSIHVANSTVTVPRVPKGPPIEAFLEMKPSPEWEGKVARVADFIQRDPRDGAPAISRTDVYLTYDSTNFYAVFVCFDQQPNSIRSRLTRRDNIGPEDDEVQIYIDTFNDHRRSYGFMTNPRGIQFDYLWTEQNGYDQSWDTIWESKGARTPQGWIGMIIVPFKSMRFSVAASQTWGLLLQRVVPRTNENLFWPKVTKSISGRLNQEGTMTGLEGISPGRNLQFIPYVAGRSFRAPDLRDPNLPKFGGAHFRGDAGLDSKMVIKDSFVFDATINPDFAQVESDEPQVTANQRFEVFFPEKRPFFMENSDYFQTPIPLLFTRRIADPMFGLRLTGKRGPYKLGMLFADDQSPGRRVPDNDPLRGKRAYFGIFRGTREFGSQNQLGLIYTDRTFQDAHNQVGGIDGRFKFHNNYTFEFQSVASADKPLGGVVKTGTAHQIWFDHSGQHLNANTLWKDNSENFITRPGFFVRPDIRRWSNYIQYKWRPEGKRLISHGPAMFTEQIWDHSGLRLTEFANVNYQIDLPRATTVGGFINGGHERLRPKDFPALVSNADYRTGHQGVFINTFYLPQLSVNGEVGWGTALNYVAATGIPFVARDRYLNLFTTVKPFAQLTIDNTYFLANLRTPSRDAAVFTNHIIRSKWNYQFTRELSLRFIMQYDALLPNSQNTFLPKQRDLNSDVLITWLLHPGTAVYLGYNTNLRNPTPVFLGAGNPPDRFVNDARGAFVKASWLFRF